MQRAVIMCVGCLLALACAAFPFAAEPAFAAAGNYSIDELSTEIAIGSDASIHVVERQTLTFDGQNTGVVWYLHAPESGESVRIASVRAVPVDDGGALIGEWSRLQLVDCDPARQGRNPGDSASSALRGTRIQPWYSYRIEDGMVRCYFPIGQDGQDVPDGGDATAIAVAATDLRTYMIETDYTIAHRVRLYRDVGELFWRYANDSLPAGASDVNLRITMPANAVGEASAEAAASITAWGHGPDNGTFAVGEDGSVSYHLDGIRQGEYAEAHVLFPASWVDSVAPGSANQFSEARRTAALAEEAAWVDAAQRGARWDYKVRVVFLVVIGLVIVVAALSVARNGRSPRSRRALIRAAATLAIVALAESLFFREPLTTALLVAFAVVMAALSLAFPSHEPATDATDVAGATDAAMGADGEEMAEE